MGKVSGKELVDNWVGSRGNSVSNWMGKKVVGKGSGKELVGNFVGNSTVCKWRNLVGKERVGKRAPQLQLDLSFLLL